KCELKNEYESRSRLFSYNYTGVIWEHYEDTKCKQPIYKVIYGPQYCKYNGAVYQQFYCSGKTPMKRECQDILCSQGCKEKKIERDCGLKFAYYCSNGVILKGGLLLSIILIVMSLL